MIRSFLLASALLVTSTFPAKAADWRMDAATSRLEFSATFERAAAPGVFREFDARIRIDVDKPAEGRLDVTIVVKSADMNSADVNNAISGPEWFDFARFPKAEFRSAEVRRVSGNRYVARGNLSLKGVQHPVEIPFNWTETGNTARLDGEFVVKRGAFGIGTGEWAATNVIGADVTVRFNVRLRKGG
jgi:polyisoprenoid-binding protein YceI